MKHHYTFALALLSVLTLGLAQGCDDGSNQKVIDEIGYGELTDGVYENAYFGVTVPVPESWHAQDRQAITDLEQTGSDIVAGGNDSLKATLEAAEQNTLTLLSVFEHPVGAPVPFNPSINIVAEKVSQFPGIKTGDDYLYHSKELLKQAAIPYNFNKDNYDEEVGGQTFRVMEATANMAGTDLTQRFYAARMKDYMFVIVLSHTDDAQKQAVLDGILDEMTFE